MNEKSNKITIYFDEKQCTGYTEKSREIDELVEKWYGRYHGDRYLLDLVELTYLLSMNKIILKHGSEYFENVEDLIGRWGRCFSSSFWPMLSVYRDLRDRGRKIRVLEQFKFLVKDKSGDLRLIYVLEEKLEIKIDRLRDIVNEALRNNIKATLAVVSLQGELTYYDIIQADIRVE